jgi:hypothetical protein
MSALLVPLTACLFVLPANAKYSGGSGTAENPYQVALGERPEDYDKHFILTADLDLDPNLPGRRVFDKAVIAPNVKSANDWHGATPFTGVFDGNRHSISHLTIEGQGYLGMLASPTRVSTSVGWWATATPAL